MTYPDNAPDLQFLNPVSDHMTIECPSKTTKHSKDLSLGGRISEKRNQRLCLADGISLTSHRKPLNFSKH